MNIIKELTVLAVLGGIITGDIKPLAMLPPMPTIIQSILAPISARADQTINVRQMIERM